MCHRMSYISYFIGCHIFSDTFIISAMDQPNLSTKVVVLQKRDIREKCAGLTSLSTSCVDRYLKMLKCSENKNKVWPARSYMNHSIHIFGCVSQQKFPSVSVTDIFPPISQCQWEDHPNKTRQEMF